MTVLYGDKKKIKKWKFPDDNYFRKMRSPTDSFWYSQLSGITMGNIGRHVDVITKDEKMLENS